MQTNLEKVFGEFDGILNLSYRSNGLDEEGAEVENPGYGGDNVVCLNVAGPHDKNEAAVAEK